MTAPQPLSIERDDTFDRVTIEGIVYAGNLFREFGIHGMPVGSTFRIEKREDGILTLQRIDATRIRIGPVELACKKCGAKDTFILDLENPNTKEIKNGGS